MPNRLAVLRFSSLAAALLLFTATAGAAELSWDVPEGCGSAEQLKRQVRRLLGRPFATVETADFEVRIHRGENGAWRLVLRTRPRRAGAEPRKRILTGKSCREVADAAAVAIAMAIAGPKQDPSEPSDVTSPYDEEESGGAEPLDNGWDTALSAADSASPDGSSSGRTDRAETAERPERDRGRGPVEETGDAEAEPLHVSFGAGLAIEGGALPDVTAGAEIELSVAYRFLRLVALGALFASQETRLPDERRGGEFELVLGGALACLGERFGPWRGSGCGGFELGQITATGIVDHPVTASEAWRAVRLEAGVGRELGAGFWVMARGGVALPLGREQFVVDGSDAVHHIGSLTGRGLLGIEFWM